MTPAQSIAPNDVNAAQVTDPRPVLIDPLHVDIWLALKDPVEIMLPQ